MPNLDIDIDPNELDLESKINENLKKRAAKKI